MRVFKQIISFAGGMLVASTMTLALAGGNVPTNIGGSITLSGNTLSINGAKLQLSGNIKVMQVKSYEITAAGYDEIFVTPAHWSVIGTSHYVAPKPSTPAQPVVTQVPQGGDCTMDPTVHVSSPITKTFTGPAIVNFYKQGDPTEHKSEVKNQVVVTYVNLLG